MSFATTGKSTKIHLARSESNPCMLQLSRCVVQITRVGKNHDLKKIRLFDLNRIFFDLNDISCFFLCKQVIKGDNKDYKCYMMT